MKKSITFFCLVLLIFMGSACEKEVRNPGEPAELMSNIPHISLGAMQSTYNEYDDITLSVNYEDGDGNIGFENADSVVVFVNDNRNDILFNFHVPPLTPEGAAVAIQGTLDVVMENVPLLNQSGNTETTTFTVWLIDRDGNQSNEVNTEIITINP